MVFSSILFLCLFLPITILLYYLCPKKGRNLFLFVASLMFYAWGEPKYIWIMLFSTVFDYTNGRLIEKYWEHARIKKTVLIVSVVGNLTMLGYFKYTDFIIQTVNSLTGSSFELLKLALPIGISFYTFQTLSYTIDVYRGNVKAKHNIIDFGMYICLFPQLIAGPIVRYTDIESELSNRKESMNLFWNGLVRFSVGLGKKVILANQIGSLWSEISNQSIIPALTAWIGALAFTFQIYFDFSGYTDMAIGLGAMFGFTFPENFLHPYESKSITEFWRRWHVTLGTWFREYVYIPLGGNRTSKKRLILNLFIVWSLTGLWHGAGWNFVLWGVFYFVVLVVEKLFLLNKLEKTPSFFQHLYTMFFVILGWMIFAFDDLKKLGEYLGAMFGANGFSNSMSIYYLVTYAVLILILVVGASSLPNKLTKSFLNNLGHRFTEFLQVIFMLFVISVSIALLVGDSFNPFLYFRF